jgi:hypothetical protein
MDVPEGGALEVDVLEVQELMESKPSPSTVSSAALRMMAVTSLNWYG